MSVRLTAPAAVLAALAIGCKASDPDTLPACDFRDPLTNADFVGGAVLEAGSCWRAEEVLSLDDGTVTIEEGVSIHFAIDMAIDVRSGGTLQISGSEDAPVELGTSDPLEAWRGIRLDDSQGTANVWEHVRIDNGGSENWSGAGYSGAAVYLSGSTTLAMDGVFVRDSRSHGLVLGSADVDVTFDNGALEGNETAAYVHPEVAEAIGGETTFADNTNSYVSVVFGNNDAVQTDRTWAALEVPWRVQDRFFVDGSLTLAPGAVVEMAQGASLRVRANAELVAEGTADDPVTVRGADTLAGFWQGISVEGQASFANAVVSGAGEERWSGAGGSFAALYADAESTLNIRETTFENHEGFAVWASGRAQLQSFDSNTITGGELAMRLHPDRVGELSGTSMLTGNDDDRIHVVFGNNDRVSTSATWLDLGVPYYISDRFFVAAPLTLEAGVVWEAAQDVGVIVEVGGSLTAAGTADAPVVLRGEMSDVDGFWKGLRILSDDAGNDLTHTILRDTGSSRWNGNAESDAAIFLADDTAMSLTDVEIGPGAGYGLFVRDNVQLSCTNVTFPDLGDGAVWDDVANEVQPGC